VFDKTNGSQVEQYELDDVDDEESPCDALRTMVIGDVRPQEVNEDQPSSNEAAPSTQANNQDQEDEQNKDDSQDQDMGNDQGGVEQDEDEDEQKESRSSSPPYPRVRHTGQQHFGDIKKGVTTRSRAANFCEHYSFVFSFKPFKLEDALRDPD
jgi:hypothetical protein